MIITIYSDPQHGWGKVNKALLDKLYIADIISKHSYMREGKAYLEIDLDLPLLFRSLRRENMEYRIEYRYSNKLSRIRGYDAYKYEAVDKVNQVNVR
jgi:hypothetical protein